MRPASSLLPSTEEVTHPFYNYTSGRWLYNEQLRLAERHLVFDAHALLAAVSKSTNRPVNAILSFNKIAEGGSYRVFEATFDGDDSVIVRIPYPCTLPRSLGVASEVATLEYLRSKGVLVPCVLDWSASSDNAVGSEYMILSKVRGRELELTWHTMSAKERMDMVEKVVDLERQLFQLELPAYGSIYHKTFLDSHPHLTSIAIEGNFCIGPSSEFLWWYKGRDEVQVNRGPWLDAQEVLGSVAERERAWLRKYGKPRFPRQPLYREFYNKQEVDPAEQILSLEGYLRVASLIVPDKAGLSKPTIRHPDLSPNNIFVSTSGEILGLIDWQHSAVLPLFIQAKVPKHFQNYGDDDSENFRPPELVDGFESLAPEEREKEAELYRKRQLHYFYVGHTSHKNESHFEAMSRYDLVIRNKLYEAAGRPWEGDNTSLRAELINASKRWPDIACSQAKDMPFPVRFSEEEAANCLDMDRKQMEADEQLQTLRDFFPINIEGWVPLELYNESKLKEEHIRAEMIGASESDEDKKEIEQNWPFQDHDEID